MKNILIGFLMAACMFLMIGAIGGSYSNSSKEVGRYQISTTSANEGIGGVKMIYIYETIADTQTGKVFRRDKVASSTAPI